MDKKILKQQQDQRLLESKRELFAPELVVKREGQSTKKVMMKDTKSSAAKRQHECR